MAYFLNKENAFRMILFVSVFIMSLYYFFFNQQYASTIAPVLGFLIFLLSVLDMVASICEKVNDNFTQELKNESDSIAYTCREEQHEYFGIENALTYDNYIDFSMYLKDYHVNDNQIELCWHLRTQRQKARKIRRAVLYVFYFIMFCIFVFLLLSHELMPYLEKLNVGEWTFFSFDIILFELLIKDQITEAIYSRIYDKIYKEMENYQEEKHGQA